MWGTKAKVGKMNGFGRRLAMLASSVLALSTAAVIQAGAADAFSAPDVDFGSVYVGVTAEREFIVSFDPGYDALGTEGPSSPFTEDPGCTHLTPTGNDWCLHVTFTPNGPGSFSSELIVKECTSATGVCGGATTVILTGIGVAFTSGTMTASPSTASPGQVISASSVTPCPAPSTVRVSLYDSSGTVLASNTAITNNSGTWGGVVTVPGNAPAGAAFVSAQCTSTYYVQNYNFVSITIGSAAPPTPLGPAPTTLTPATVVRANPTIFHATLTSNGAAAPGQTVQFSTKNLLGGTVVQCSAITATNGVATCAGSKPAYTFSYASTYTARFAGNANYVAATATGHFA